MRISCGCGEPRGLAQRLASPRQFSNLKGMCHPSPSHRLRLSHSASDSQPEARRRTAACHWHSGWHSRYRDNCQCSAAATELGPQPEAERDGAASPSRAGRN
eukprot:2071277-Rhodomonas_salina.1